MKHALITGASGGIGYATASLFGRMGFTVHTVSRRACDLPGVQHHRMDLLEPGAVEHVSESIRDVLFEGDTLCVVHNAAVMDLDTAYAFEADRFNAVMHINVTVPALLTAQLLPHMGVGSSIIYIGSTLSEKGVASRLSYVTSKHAIVGLMRATVQDLHGKGVHAVCVCPGFTDTEILRPVFDAHPEFEKIIRDKVSFGRLIAPEEIADVIYYAATHPVLNGAVLHANLGQRET